MKKSSKSNSNVAWYSIAVIALLNIAYQLYASRKNAATIAQAKPLYLLLAVLSEIFAYLVLVPAYRSFFAKRNISLGFLQSLGLLFAGVGLSKVIPFGEYILWRQKLKSFKGGVAASSQFIVLFITWLLSALIILFLVAELLAAIFNPSQQVGLLAKSFSKVPIVLTVIILGIVGSTRLPSFRLKIGTFFREKLGTETLSPVAIIRENNLGIRELGFLTVGAFLTWIFEAITLYLCLRALGLAPPIFVALFGYCFARIFIIFPLFPGGIGEVETATTLFFVSYGFPAGPVFTATVLFRLLTYWMPIISGGSTYALARRKKSPQKRADLVME